MMMKNCIAVFACTLLLFSTLDAQVFFRARPSGSYRNLPERRYYRKQNFKPTLSFSLGYGMPNLDKYELLEFGNYYHTTMNQKGPVFGSIEYQFNRSMSIGCTLAFGKVSTPYYSNYNSTPAFTGFQKNTCLMICFVRNLSTRNEKIIPYMKTEIGINFWTQDYLDQSGNKVILAEDPAAIAYQVAIGAKFMVAKQAGLFAESGYGKYILAGGLTFKF